MDRKAKCDSHFVFAPNKVVERRAATSQNARDAQSQQPSTGDSDLPTVCCNVGLSTIWWRSVYSSALSGNAPSAFSIGTGRSSVNGDGRNEKAAAYLYPACLHLLQAERRMCPFPIDAWV